MALDLNDYCPLPMALVLNKQLSIAHDIEPWKQLSIAYSIGYKNDCKLPRPLDLKKQLFIAQDIEP